MAKKVFVLKPNEDWICDRIVNEWYEFNSDISTNNLIEADCIWLYADFAWNQIPYEFLKQRYSSGTKIVTTIHHIVPEKFGNAERIDFARRDAITNAYHVYNKRTKAFIETFTNKPITIIPYWGNQYLFRSLNVSKFEIRSKHNIICDDNALVIASFQRDTEGRDLISPKLEKGPDLLADAIERVSKTRKVHVLLSGWRRQYVISRLQKANISFTYIERPNLDVINELYNAADVYFVTSRCEGGPQSLIECGLTCLPCVSRPVGIAEQVLPKEAIADDVSTIVDNACIPNVEHMKIPQAFKTYRSYFVNT